MMFALILHFQLTATEKWDVENVLPVDFLVRGVHGAVTIKHQLYLILLI
jgi:hypothetical protein